MSRGVQFKITVPHNKSTDWHEWYFPNGHRDIGPTEQRDRGAKLRGVRDGFFPPWFVLACNNPDCDARAAIPVSALTDWADANDPAVSR